MYKVDKNYYKLIGVIFINIALLAYAISTISIRYEEAVIFFDKPIFLHYYVNFFTDLFGVNDYSLRLPMVLLYVLSAILMYAISKKILQKDKIALYSTFVFMFLPGIHSSAILVNPACLMIFFTLVFCFLYLYEHKKTACFVLLFVILVDNSCVFLYFALFVYGVVHKNKLIYTICGSMLVCALYYYGIDTSGKPRGYFLDTFGSYSLVFSPFIFVYFTYCMYRIASKNLKEKNILFYISFTVFSLSLLLSFRQKLALEDYAPFVVLSVPLMLKVFYRSYLVRLPQNRKSHKLAAVLAIAVLVLNLVISYGNMFLYNFLDNPSNHFANKYHIAKELSQELKKQEAKEVFTSDKKLEKRLEFYKINSANRYLLSAYPLDNVWLKSKIDIKYHKITAASYYLYDTSIKLIK